MALTLRCLGQASKNAVLHPPTTPRALKTPKTPKTPGTPLRSPSFFHEHDSVPSYRDRARQLTVRFADDDKECTSVRLASPASTLASQFNSLPGGYPVMLGNLMNSKAVNLKEDPAEQIFDARSAAAATREAVLARLGRLQSRGTQEVKSANQYPRLLGSSVAAAPACTRPADSSADAKVLAEATRRAVLARLERRSSRFGEFVI
eukprot:TRINITY_DN217_c0_g1_i1.p1 TRINITY_DN217_c0_g1~~TRINITY_DN217_c0_g1_i1.p1  ORF type:complete len:205 (-),score=29.08 TRINITY_DN217_c0_g1_i1:59-673(-)